jgi:hypothetical protein
MAAVAIRTSKSPNVLRLVATILLSIFAISLPFMVPDPGPHASSEVQFIGP